MDDGYLRQPLCRFRLAGCILKVPGGWRSPKPGGGSLVILSLALALAPVVRAQQTPHVAYVYPAGGQVGTTFQIVVGGQYLSGITNFEVILDGGLASAKIIGYNRQLKPDEQQALKEELTKFQEQTEDRRAAHRAGTWQRVNEIKQTLTSSAGGPPTRPSANS